MGIFGALTTAVTGMQAQAFALQNVSGNIANSQTTAFKRTDTSFTDLLQDNIPSKQIAGNTIALSRQTNTVQGDVQNASVPTFMAINGGGFFVVQKPDSFADGRPNFSGVDLYTRRGDFTLDQNGYLVNGAGYYLMGIPVDATTGNLAGSVPEMLQFQNGFLPATATTELNYRANLPAYPKTVSADTAVPGSELLNPANYSANPVNGAPTVAKLIGYGATISPDAAAALTGSADLNSLLSAGGTLEINGQPITIVAGDTATDVRDAINLLTGTTNVAASIDATTHQLVLTGTDAETNIAIGGGSTLAILTELGLSVGTTNATNLITQGIAAAGQTLTFKVGSNPTLTLTFGPGDIMTLADLNVELAALVGGTASADPLTGNVTVSAATNTDSITVGGTATARNFGIRTSTALPSNSTVVAQDQSTFLTETIAGGAVTAYDVAGSAVNVQIRWAKVDAASLGAGHSDKWNMFYSVDSSATGTQTAWQNVGVDYTFSANGSLTPSINSVTLNNVTVNGVALGTLRIVHSTGGVTQYSDSNGSVKVNQFEQNGFGAGELQTIAVSDKGRIVGTYSNGRTIDMAEVTLANFSGANGLKKLDGGAFGATAESGTPTYGAAGKILGSSLEGSNTDIADEFTKLIVTQQAYSANTKVITTTNTMIQDLLNVIR